MERRCSFFAIAISTLSVLVSAQIALAQEIAQPSTDQPTLEEMAEIVQMLDEQPPSEMMIYLPGILYMIDYWQGVPGVRCSGRCELGGPPGHCECQGN